MVKSVRHILNKLGFDWYEYHIRKTAKRLENKKYDTYIAYMEGLAAQLCSCVNSDNKIVWIHMDCESEYINSKVFLPFYFFERIVSVSTAAKDAFCRKHPILAPKTTSINNLLNIEDVKSKSLALPILDKQNALLFNNDTFSIISVGRVCAVKQFFFIPQIATELLKKDLNFKWYIIGGGPDMEVQLVQDSIAKYKVEENVVLLGPSSNPYPFIKESDLLVLLSSSEAFPTVINEAKVIGTPIVSTNFNAVHEIMNEQYGLIVSLDQMADAIEKMMKDKEYYNQIKSNLSTFEYDNEAVLKQIYEIL